MFDVFIFDMNNSEHNVARLKRKFPHAQIMRYAGNHYEMLKRASEHARTEFFWALSSICDYSGFKLDFFPSPDQAYQIHVWASGTQAEGDTFLVPTDRFKSLKTTTMKLAWYLDVNYHKSNIDRLEWPVVEASHDLYRAVMDHKFKTPYVEFRMNGVWNAEQAYPSMWEHMAVVAVNDTGSVSLVPNKAQMAFKSQIYDWPYIQYLHSKKTLEKPLDVVFISYDEENAEENWSALVKICPRAQRIQGVKGLLRALQTAAASSRTDYFYAVFGKNLIDPNFKFDTYPDRLRKPAHYVFQAYNPLLDHAYGHDGVVMYNKMLLLGLHPMTTGDITMTAPIVNIPIVSCQTIMADEWAAWRTAFREVFKLMSIPKPSIDDEYNLSKWLTCNPAGLGKWALRGAHDAWQLNGAARHEIEINDWDYLKRLFEHSKIKMEKYESTSVSP